MRIALTSYRSKPHCGGQGVYVRQLSKALVGLGHRVEVFSGPPYPDLDEGVALTRVPSLDLYREPDPFRIPRPSELTDRNNLLEFLIMCTAGFPEPRTFSRRVVPLLRDRAAEFDVVHDNQTLAPALLDLPAAGLPLLSTVHHPISVDRAIGLASAPLRKKPALWRWYGFVRTQARVARAIPLSVTPSSTSAADAVRDFGMRPEQLVTIPLGVDVDQFRPRGPRTPGRIVALCSADVPLKGLTVLLRAVAALPAEPDALLTVVTEPAEGGPTEKLIAELGIGHRVRFVSGLGPAELAELMASAEIVSVPSLYEGFSLPAVEAMASGTPVVASDTGALPEVVGRDGTCGVLVPPGDPLALASVLRDLLADPARREAMGEAARRRAVERFSWPVTARSTVEVYRRVMALHEQGRPASGGRRDAGETDAC
ncbi:MAG TPA: glycosyltransferase family 4 protein [Mycobacteriales bacterium]